MYFIYGLFLLNYITFVLSNPGFTYLNLETGGPLGKVETGITGSIGGTNPGLLMSF